MTIGMSHESVGTAYGYGRPRYNGDGVGRGLSLVSLIMGVVVVWCCPFGFRIVLAVVARSAVFGVCSVLFMAAYHYHLFILLSLYETKANG